MIKRALPVILLLTSGFAAGSDNSTSGLGKPGSPQTPAPAEVQAPDSKLKKAIELTRGLQSLERVVVAAQAKKDYPTMVTALERMHALYPYNGEIMLRLVSAYALTDEKRKAFEMLYLMQRQGLAADLEHTPNLDALKKFGLFPYLSKLMAEAKNPFGKADSIFTIGDPNLLATAVLKDPKRDRFLVGSARRGLIYAVMPPNRVSILADAQHTDGLWSVMDLALDSQRDVLWVASAAIPFYLGYGRDNVGHTALLKLDANTGKLLQRYNIPAIGKSHRLSNLALAGDGSVFATDQSAPGVYRLAPGRDTLERIFEDDRLTSLRGLALGKDDKVLYIADQAAGLIALDLPTGQPKIVAAKDTTNLGAIESLRYYDGALIGLQPLMHPARLMRFVLNSDGSAITSASPLAANLPEFAAPLRFSLNGDHYLMVANSHFTDVLPNGQANPNKSLRAVSVISGALKPPLSSAEAEIRKKISAGGQPKTSQ